MIPDELFWDTINMLGFYAEVLYAKSVRKGRYYNVGNCVLHCPGSSAGSPVIIKRMALKDDDACAISFEAVAIQWSAERSLRPFTHTNLTVRLYFTKWHKHFNTA